MDRVAKDRTQGRLRAAPAGLIGSVEAEARRDAVWALVGVLTALNIAIKELDRSILAHLGEHPDARVFTSLPRSGKLNAAQVLAEWATAAQPTTARRRWRVWPARLRSPAAPASTPRSASARRATSGCARRSASSPTTPTMPARGQPRSNADARARGLDHPHAIRVLARAWIRVIWRCWQDGMP